MFDYGNNKHVKKFGQSQNTRILLLYTLNVVILQIITNISTCVLLATKKRIFFATATRFFKFQILFIEKTYLFNQ